MTPARDRGRGLPVERGSSDYEETAPMVSRQGGEPPVMAVPVGEPVRLVLNSLRREPRLLRPAVPHQARPHRPRRERPPNELEFTVTEAGTYAGQCAEFCGTPHADMTFTVEAMPRARLRRLHRGPARRRDARAVRRGECGRRSRSAASNIAFDTDSFEVPADADFCIEFTNHDDVRARRRDLRGGEALFTGEILAGPAASPTTCPAMAAGDYHFICDFHPTMMVGDLTVTE